MLRDNGLDQINCLQSGHADVTDLCVFLPVEMALWSSTDLHVLSLLFFFSSILFSFVFFKYV